MDSDVTMYLAGMTDEQLGLFWIIASKAAREWITGELARRAVERGDVLVEPKGARTPLTTVAA